MKRRQTHGQQHSRYLCGQCRPRIRQRGKALDGRRTPSRDPHRRAHRKLRAGRVPPIGIGRDQSEPAARARCSTTTSPTWTPPSPPSWTRQLTVLSPSSSSGMPTASSVILRRARHRRPLFKRLVASGHELPSTLTSSSGAALRRLSAQRGSARGSVHLRHHRG